MGRLTIAVGRMVALMAVSAGLVLVPVSAAEARVAGQQPGFGKAGPGLSAFARADTAELEAALGDAIIGVEDDGGVSGGSGGFVSVARATTGSSVEIEIRLSSNTNAEAAKRQFESLTSGLSGSALAGVGDEAFSSPGQAVVRTGAQVLQVLSGPGELAQQKIEEAKEKTGDPGSVLQAIEAKAGAVAPALAKGMTGDAVKKPLLAVPTGGVDVCKQVPASAVENIFRKGPVSATPALAQNPPGFACSYSASFGSFVLSVVTVDQLANGTPAGVYEHFDDERARLQATGDPAASELSGPREVAALLDQPCPAARVAVARDLRSGVTPPNVQVKLRKVVRVTGRVPPTPLSISDILARKNAELAAARAAYRQSLDDLFNQKIQPVDVDRAEEAYYKKAIEVCKLRLKIAAQRSSR